MELNSKLITITEAIELIASRDFREFDTRRSAKDRARKRVNYAIKKNELRPVEGKLQLKHFGFWARDVWPTKFNDLPAVSYPYSVEAPLSITVLPSIPMPQTLDDCYKEIRALRKEVELLKPLAEKWKNFCEGNRHKRKKPE